MSSPLYKMLKVGRPLLVVGAFDLLAHLSSQAFWVRLPATLSSDSANGYPATLLVCIRSRFELSAYRRLGKIVGGQPISLRYDTVRQEY